MFLPTRYGHGNTKTNCDFCGADGADGCRHQSSTCPHDQDLSMEQSRVLIMDKNMSFRDYRTLGNDRIKAASLEHYHASADQISKWTLLTAEDAEATGNLGIYTHIKSMGDSISGNVERLVEQYLQVPGVQEALDDEKDPIRGNKLIFTVNADGFSGRNVSIVCRLANLRGQTGDVKSVLPIAAMRIKETRAGLQKLMRMHDWPKEVSGFTCLWLFVCDGKAQKAIMGIQGGGQHFCTTCNCEKQDEATGCWDPNDPDKYDIVQPPYADEVNAEANRARV